jgi:myo-inositol-1(or 4)-monophosphatase
MVRSDDPEVLLEVAVEAARTAGSLLLERFLNGTAGRISSKTSPTDLVSEADLASERAIGEVLARRRPEDGLLAEEGGELAGRSGLRWIVDPLDGTVNYLFGMPHWCVSVAVEDATGTVVGAVFDPNREELYTALRDGPALLNGIPLSPRRGEDLSHAMVATGLSYEARVRAAQARVLARLIPRVRDIRRFGSAALDLAWTAAGLYDAYFERSVRRWDVAAGALICRRSGLRVLDLPIHDDLPWGILAAPPALADELLELAGGPASV